jgi:hypothetical protein
VKEQAKLQEEVKAIFVKNYSEKQNLHNLNPAQKRKYYENFVEYVSDAKNAES